MLKQSISELVRAAASGDREAFEVLVKQSAAMVTAVAYSQCGNFDLSEDIAQEAFLDAWTNLSTIREPEKFLGWVCTITRRRAIDTTRTSNSIRSAGTLGESVLEIPDQKQSSPEAVMSMQEERELVWSMLALLPEVYREPLILFYRCEESTRDVAIALDESEATIRQRLKRGRDMLRAELTESLRNTLGVTVPKATFAAMIMASLPTSTFAAGASTTTATATAVKTNSSANAATTSAIGGAILGSLAGIAGGVFGTWMSWKNCEYESQQKFILRQVLQYVVGLSVFGFIIAILVAARRQGAIPDESVYSRWLISLIVVSQILNVAWIWRCIRGYKKIGDEAKRRGDPIRPTARLQQIDFNRQQTQAMNAANAFPPERFSWNAAGWFGGCIGSSAWMAPLCGIAYWNGSQSLAIVCCLSFLITLSLSVVAWQFQQHLDAYVAVQLLIGLLFLTTTSVFACVQFLGDSATQNSVQWTPWAWCVLFMFPLISLRMWWMRRSFAKQVAHRIR